jgi:hypothetical protein
MASRWALYLPSAAGASIAALAAARACVRADAGGADAVAPAPPPPSWASPSPYDASVAPGRFPDTAHLRLPAPGWDLPRLYALWQAGGDAWPWVWCQRNATGPHFVFVGVGPGTLAAIARVSAESASNNITVVLAAAGGGDDDGLARHGVSEERLFALRCAVVRGRVAQVDAHARLLMLDDERIIAYDAATLA